jgi:hypothetical protein
VNHRAVIETIHPSGSREMRVVAAGPPDYCQRMLLDHLKANGLAHNQDALILEIVSSA